MKMKNNMIKRQISQYDLCRDILKEQSISRVKRIIAHVNSDSFLTFIALRSENGEVKKLAFDKILNQKFYWIIIKNIDNENKRKEVLEKITDENVLAEIAVFESDIKVALTALYILGEKRLISVLSRHGTEQTRIEAINFIDDKEELIKIASFEGQFESVAKFATKKAESIN